MTSTLISIASSEECALGFQLPNYQLTQPVPPAPACRGACRGLPNSPSWYCAGPRGNNSRDLRYNGI